MAGNWNRVSLATAMLACCIAIGAAVSASRSKDGAAVAESARPQEPAPREVIVVSAAAAEPSGPPPEPPAAESGVTADSPQAADEYDLSVHEAQAQVAATFDVERLDWSWSAAAETSLRRAVETELPERSRLRQVECRSTMCRVDVEHAELDGHTALVRALIARRPWNAPMYAPPPANSGDGLSATLFVAREGHQLVGLAE